MITTIKKAKLNVCPMKMSKESGYTCCDTIRCMAWEFWVPPPGSQLQMEKVSHGVKDQDKLGYCGLSKRR